MLGYIRKKIFLSLRKIPFIFDAIKKISREIGETNEEYELLAEYKKIKKEIFIMQIGANDGISNDPVREFLVSANGWHGYLIEPIPYLFDKLKNNYKGNKRVQFFQCAISDKTGGTVIYSIKKSELYQLPFYSDQIASFDKSHLIKHFPDLSNLDNLIEEITVDTYTINDFIVKNKIERIDVLVIDVEGYEKQLLETFPYCQFKPEIIIFETLHMNESDRSIVFSVLKKQGFLLYTSVFDTIAISNKIANLAWVKKYNAS